MVPKYHPSRHRERAPLLHPISGVYGLLSEVDNEADPAGVKYCPIGDRGHHALWYGPPHLIPYIAKSGQPQAAFDMQLQ